MGWQVIRSGPTGSADGGDGDFATGWRRSAIVLLDKDSATGQPQNWVSCFFEVAEEYLKSGS